LSAQLVCTRWPGGRGSTLVVYLSPWPVKPPTPGGFGQSLQPLDPARQAPTLATSSLVGASTQTHAQSKGLWMRPSTPGFFPNPEGDDRERQYSCGHRPGWRGGPVLEPA